MNLAIRIGDAGAEHGNRLMFGMQFVRSVVAIGATSLPLTLSATPALTFNESTGGTANNAPHTVGWQFDVEASVIVNGLGWYDQGADGLSTEHRLGLWSPSGDLLVEATVATGNVAPLDGQFRTVSIAPITLPIGAGYVIGGLNQLANTERLACGSSSGTCANSLVLSVDPRISFVGAMFGSEAAGFSRPTTAPAGAEGFFGPSFSIVPEPTSALLLAIAICGAIAVRRRPL
jgi:hypothetical protein